MFKVLATGLQRGSERLCFRSYAALPPYAFWTQGDGGQNDPVADELKKVLTMCPAENAGKMPLTINQNERREVSPLAGVTAHESVAISVGRIQISRNSDRKVGTK